MAAVWGDRTPATATNTLQVHISHLRRLVGKEAVRSHGTYYVLELPAEAIDAEQFVEAVHEAARMRRRQHFGRAAEILDGAVALWRGTPFPDIADPDLEARRARLAELRDQAREDLLECRLELARDAFELADVVAEARELVSRHPEREKGQVLLVRALAAADRPGEACAAFEAAQDRMRSSMGLDPSRELIATHARTLNQDPLIYPLAMRSVTAVPPAKGIDAAQRATAQRAREAVVDLGASLVTVLCADDDEERHHLADAIARALAPDLPTGVLVIDTERAEQNGLPDAVDAAVKDATGGTCATLEDLPDRARLGLIVITSNGSLATPLVDMLEEWVQAPRLVVIGPESLDCDTEVVIAHGRHDVHEDQGQHEEHEAKAPKAPVGARA